MKKWWVAGLMSICIAFQAYSQLNSFDFDRLDSIQAASPKHVVIFLHTDWCSVCKRMEHTTFSDSTLVATLNQHFWYVPFNAESEQAITYHGRTFQFKPTGVKTGVHELAQQLGTIDGQLNYPTVVILSPEDEIVFQYGGLLKRDAFLEVLRAVE